MTAQEYYQDYLQNPTPYYPPPPYPQPDPSLQYQGCPPQSSPTLQDSKPSYPSPKSSSPFQRPTFLGTPQPQPFQQPFLPPPNQQLQQQQQQQQPPFPPPIQTRPPYMQIQAQAPQFFPDHLRPTRSYSEPPSPRDYERHRRRHGSHGRRRSPSRSIDSDSSRDESTDSSQSRSRHRHRDRDIDYVHPSARNLTWADKARGKKDHTGRNTFWGAFGGGVIGDLIAPGLGTLGGAVLGGWGGHEAGRGRSGSGNGRDAGRSRTRKRDRYDEEWEAGRRRRGEI